MEVVTRPTILERLFELQPEQLALLLPILVIVLGSLVAIISVTSYQWRRLRERDHDTQLKLQLLERGLSAEEIATIVAANGDATSEKRR